jgi:hypothetical protein
MGDFGAATRTVDSISRTAEAVTRQGAGPRSAP